MADDSYILYTKDGADAEFAEKGEGGSLPDQSGNAGKYLTTDGTTPSWATVEGGGSVSSDDITDATTIGKKVLTASDATVARSAIGAGTSDLTVGTSASDALAGDTKASDIGGIVVGGTSTINPATGTVQDVEIVSDESDSGSWPNRYSYWFTDAAGADYPRHRTFTLNEFGELRVSPGRFNTVPFRVFDRELNSYPEHTGNVIEYMDNRTDRNVLFAVDTGGNVTTVGTVAATNIGNKVTGGSTEPESPAIGDIWVDTSGA